MRKLIKFILPNLPLLAILSLASLLRFWNITSMPPSLNWDEISHGFNAYSILKTGKDEWGVTLPTIFRAYGDYKLPVYIYLTALSEFIFGLNAFALRFPSGLAGIGAVLFTYLLASRLFSKEVGLLSAFLVAVEPWSLFLSRGAFEANLALFFIISGVYFFFRGLEVPKQFVISAFLLGLSVWTYNSARIFVPLLVVVIIALYLNEVLRVWSKNKKVISYSLVIISFFFLPMFWQLFQTVGQARYGRVAILDEGAIARIERERANSSLSPELSYLVNNKYVFFSKQFLSNWFSHFSPSFLFSEGGSNYQFNVPYKGLLYLPDALFFSLGLILLARMRSKSSALILSWLLLGPIPSSLTREAPHTLRAITMLPMPMVVSAYGLVSILGWIRSRTPLPITYYPLPAFGLYVLLMLSFTWGYLNNYFGNYRQNYSWSWQYGYKEVVDYTKEHYSDYDKIIVTKKYGEPHEFFLFYWPWDPNSYRNDPNLVRYHQSDWYWVDSFDKFYFVNDWDVPKESGKWVTERKVEIDVTKTTLLITSPDNFPRGWTKLQTIYFLDGKPAFDILEKNV